MLNMVQLDFFEPCEVTLLKWEIEKIKKTSGKKRKPVFNQAEFDKKYLHLLERMDVIEKNLCMKI